MLHGRRWLRHPSLPPSLPLLLFLAACLPACLACWLTISPSEDRQTVSPFCLRAVEGHWPASKVILFSCLFWSDPAGAVLHACWFLSLSFSLGIDCVRSFLVCLRLHTPPTGFHDLGFEVGRRRLRDPVGAV
ncbi:hypothetical protein B0I37DRAFT_47400 [Chaetomium sp. MPI-CAGE-AT-0009]|nr:hypothetical protein B0I37DRAFT_47400 [Chaetomium sp. MPI-CAGE-AT-0009]